MKGALDSLAPGWLLAARFLPAAAIVFLVYRRRVATHLDRSHALASLVIGIPGGLGFLLQNVGLAGTTPGRNAFLTATYCVMAPFVTWAMGSTRPGVSNLFAALLCFAGVGFLSLGGDLGSLSPALSQGDLLTLLGAALFAVNIVAIGVYGRGRDAVTLTALQLLVSGALCLAWALAAEPMPGLADLGSSFWLEICYLVVLSTVIAFVVQNVAQQHVEPSQAALLFSLESVFGTVFSVLIYREQITAALLVGFSLIFVAVIVSELSAKDA